MKQKRRTKRLLALGLLLVFVLGLALAPLLIARMSVAGSVSAATSTLPSQEPFELPRPSSASTWGQFVPSWARLTDPFEVFPGDNDYTTASTLDAVSYSYEDDTHILRIDLWSNEIHFRTAIANQDQGGRQSVEGMARDHGAIAAINADYSCLYCDPCCGSARWPEGMTWIDGEDRTYREENYWGADYWRSSLAISASNQADIARKEARQNSSNNYNVVGGGPQFVFDGQFRWIFEDRESDVLINDEPFKPDAANWRYDTRAKTAAGITSDGRWLILAVSPSGKTMDQFGQFLIQRGVSNAIRFDSGGSSAMYYYGVKHAGRDVVDALLVIPGPPATTRPTAPSNLSASATGRTSIHLTWNDNSNNEDGFKVFRDGSQIATVGADTTSYDDNGLSCGTTYSYYVKAYNGAGDSDPSNTDSATTQDCPPPAAPSPRSPSNGTSLRSCENITLDWHESSGASEYYAEYWGAGSGNSGWIGGTGWNIGTKSPGAYYWHVKARNQWGDSDWSATWSFTVNSNQAPNIPSPQSPGDGTWVNSRTVTLQWQDNGDPDNCPRDYRTYNVEISRPGWSNGVNDHSGTSWQATVPSDDDYQWRAQAYDGDLTSPWSGYRTVKVDATPPDTTITSGPQGDIPVGDASFSWTGSDNRTPTGDLVYSYRLRGLNDNWSAWSGSTSLSYNGLPNGDYTFEVKARDLAGNEDDTPASRSFFVDTTPPDTTVTSGPSGCIGAADVTFTWTGSDNRTPTAQLQYSYWLEGYDPGWSGWSSVTSKTYTGLPDGPYTFHVKAKDGVGHEDPSPAGRSFQVDITPPAGSVLINGGDSTTNQIAVRLDITGDDGPVGCGVTEMRLANDDHNYKDWRGFEEPVEWYLPGVNRTTWTVHLQLKDLVGNVSGAFTDDIYLDFYPPRPASTSYQLGARVTAGGDGRPTSESYQVGGSTLGQPLDGGRTRSRWYRLESGFQGAWLSAPQGRPSADEYDVWRSVMASSGDAPKSEHYWLYGTSGQPTSDGLRSSENYQLVSGFWLPAGWDVCGDDFDRSGVIGMGDIEQQIAHWRTSMGDRDPDRNPETPNYEGRFDRDLDGETDVVDVVRVMVRWGRRCWVNNP